MVDRLRFEPYLLGGESSKMIYYATLAATSQ